MHDGLAALETNLLKAISTATLPAPAPPGSLPGSAGEGSQAQASSFVRDSAARFESRPVTGSTPPMPPWVGDVTTPHFNRAPDATKLFCNIHDKVNVARSKFREKLLVLIYESGLKEDCFDLIGDPLDYRFELQFKGDTRMASLKAKQFHSSLMLGRGKWKTQEVEDSLGELHKFYINPDKNPSQVRREVLTKHLQGIISDLCPDKDKDFFAKKSSGSIYCERRVVATVFVPERKRHV